MILAITMICSRAGETDCVKCCFEQALPGNNNSTNNSHVVDLPMNISTGYKEELLELGPCDMFNETDFIPENSECTLQVFQNHGIGINCKDQVQYGCYRVYQLSGNETEISTLLAAECQSRSLGFNDTLNFNVSSDISDASCPVTFYDETSVVLFYVLFGLFVVIGGAVMIKTKGKCGKRGLFSDQMRSMVFRKSKQGGNRGADNSNL
mmetsp:Transcript_23262/g.34348  ORF Transcript_23262/g.34348 Transcript_23262/m.34348 type:complete len:208 (-) Transcript_23262:116-739(-)